MAWRFYIDAGTGEPHVDKHGVTEGEVIEVLEHCLESRRGRDGTIVRIGRTSAGRYLRVVFVPESVSGGFVITAMDLRPQERTALNKRLKKKI